MDEYHPVRIQFDNREDAAGEDGMAMKKKRSLSEQVLWQTF